MTWTPEIFDLGDVGALRVVVGRKDVTFWRYNADYPNRNLTQIGGWQDTDPYGSNNATLIFPQITEFDTIGSGELDWFYEGAKVRIDLHNNGELVENLFFGFVSKIIVTSDSVSALCSGDLIGRAALESHEALPGRRRVKDIGQAIKRELDPDWKTGGGRYDMNEFVTGLEVEWRGDRTLTALGYVNQCLEYAVKADGSSLTILPAPERGARAYDIQWRDITTQHATVDAGAHGVKIDLSKDVADEPTRIFGEGVAPNGERWRNAKYPNLGKKTVPEFPTVAGGPMSLGDTDADTSTGDGVSVMARELWGNGDLAIQEVPTGVFSSEIEQAVEETQEDAGLPVTGTVDQATWKAVFSAEYDDQSWKQAFFKPLAADTRVVRWLTAGDGTVIGRNPNFDPDVMRVDEFVSYGADTPKRQARRNARAKLKRRGGWAGTIILTSDPAEMSRFQLRAGMNLRVNHLKGGMGQLLHISAVTVDWKNGVVKLSVSTQGRHYLDLAVRKERDRAARRDLGLEFQHMLSKSKTSMDVFSGWEGESGAGIIKPTELSGGSWNIVRVVACELGVMGRLKLDVDAPTTFYVAAFGRKVDEDLLNARLGNPSVWVDEEERVDVWMDNADWLIEADQLMIDAWGTPDQPCGLWPKPFLNKKGERSVHPVNGKHRDPAAWQFWTEDNFIYLAVWPAASCTLTGRMRIQINEAS